MISNIAGGKKGVGSQCFTSESEILTVRIVLNEKWCR